ncbi:hypothetical protein CBL_09651 [Carabus blaptoides fortunei]
MWLRSIVSKYRIRQQGLLAQVEPQIPRQHTGCRPSALTELQEHFAEQNSTVQDLSVFPVRRPDRGRGLACKHVKKVKSAGLQQNVYRMCQVSENGVGHSGTRTRCAQWFLQEQNSRQTKDVTKSKRSQRRGDRLFLENQRLSRLLKQKQQEDWDVRGEDLFSLRAFSYKKDRRLFLSESWRHYCTCWYFELLKLYFV